MNLLVPKGLGPVDAMSGKPTRLSVVIPAFNEEGNIARLIEETYAAVPETMLGEVIVVDDASDDRTGLQIKGLIPRYATLRYLRHGRRAGQSAALRTAVLASRYPAVAAMDGDGQNDPRDIAALFERLGEPGEEPALVGGLRATRKDTSSKRLASRFANWLRDKILDDGCPDTGCGLKVYQREAYLALPFFTSMHRYLPAFFQTYGHQVTYVPVNDRPRLSGASKYTNLGRALIGIYDLVGVSWLRKRTALPSLSEQVEGAAIGADDALVQAIGQRG